MEEVESLKDPDKPKSPKSPKEETKNPDKIADGDVVVGGQVRHIRSLWFDMSSTRSWLGALPLQCAYTMAISFFFGLTRLTCIDATVPLNCTWELCFMGCYLVTFGLDSLLLDYYTALLGACDKSISQGLLNLVKV